MNRLTVLLLFLMNASFAQDAIPTGFWRTHYSYYNVTEVEKYGDRLYCVSNGNMFYVDLTLNTMQPFSKIQGLTDVGISTIKYHPGLDVLIVGYENGNIDILQDNIVYSIPEIKSSSNIFGSKRINEIYPFHDFAFLSTDLGLIQIDINRLEIKESFTNIGTNGDNIEVYSTTINESIDSIFIYSQQGVMAAKYTASVNLKDFNNWHTYNANEDSVKDKEIMDMVSFKDTTYAATKNDGIFYYESGGWLKYGLPVESEGELRSVSLSNGQMHVVTINDVFSINDISDYVVYSNDFEDIHDAGRHNDKIYLAIARQGVKHDLKGYFQNNLLNGPIQVTGFHLNYYNGRMISLPGGYSKQNYSKLYNSFGFNEFAEGTWANYGPNSYPTYLSDLVASEYNYNDGCLYFASYDNGLLKRAPNGQLTVLNEGEAPLTTLAPNVIWLTDVEMDNSGGLWVANIAPGIGDNSLHVLRANGSWESFNFPFYDAARPLDIVIDANNTKWVMLGGPGGASGVLAFNENGNNFKHLNAQPGNGGLPSSDVKSIIVDKENQVWVGTTKGVAVFYNPSAVFSTGFFEAETPVFQNRPLLREEVITAIEVDGGNRKWIGTSNGLWLFNPTGTKVISKFTTKNSPLPSNTIQDIEINDLTGEVFISTDQGLVSYRGTATEGSEGFDNVEIFPNPITTDFDGVLTVTGLTENANVKFTDISGKLMYETQANGGTAVWNMRDYNDIYAKTGVYMIFAASQDGEEAYVGKVALIHK